jgi:MFS family permease
MNAPLSSLSRPRIPRTVWALGLVSLFMDLSSELIHALLPIFLVSTMGMSVVALGALEGAAEATTMIVKVFSGPLSDWLGKRKGLLLVGYGLAALTKPLFPLATTPFVVAVARLVDRLGKGIRGAPRDALVADVAPPAIRGACFGLRQSMDTVGAVAGPLLAMALMFAFADRIRTVLWFAVAPAFICVGLLFFGVEEPERPSGARPFRSPLQWRAVRAFPSRYWFVVVVGATFTLARFSEAFLVLRAQQAGFDLAWVPAVMAVMSVTYALSAYPVGKLSDRLDRRVLLAAGLALLMGADLTLGRAASAPFVFAGVALWGLHMGFTQGILATMVADASPAALRGTAFGIFNLVSGASMLLSSILAGWLWERYGAPTTFWTSAALAAAPLAMCAFAPAAQCNRGSD